MTTVRLELPPKLIPVFSGEADVRGSYGGRGSSKTRTFAKMSAVRAYMWDAEGREGQILCARQFMNSLADSSMEEVKAAIRSEPWLLERFDIGEKYIRTKSGRVYYSFRGLDRNIDSVKSSTRILLGWVDEAEPVTDEAWVKLIPTLREEDSELWVTWNPESDRSPTHRRFLLSKDPRFKISEMNWRDNPWFPSKLERDRLRDLAERPDQYGHIWEGEFATVFEGAYYVRELLEAKNSGRIGSMPYDPSLPVHTAWDLGVGDSTAIWFFQVHAGKIAVIDIYEANGRGLGHYAELLRSKPYRYGDDWVPHDAKVREFGTGKTRIEQMVEHGLHPRLVPDHKVEDGIQAVRDTLGRCWFNEPAVGDGLAALRQYRTEFDDGLATFKPRPRHDWTSHAADAFRYLAMAWREIVPEQPKSPEPKTLYDMTFDQVLQSTPTRSGRV